MNQLTKEERKRRKYLNSLHGGKSFANGLNFYKLFWIFFIGCIAGVIIETIWCIITRFHYENRVGLIYGPFNLVYGFGALFMTLGLYWLRNKSDIIIIIGGSIIGSIFEYICSWVQETMFGTVSWNYSAFKFNLNGRINLLYSIFWGILALVWLKYIFRLTSYLIEKIPNSIGRTLTWVLLIFMIFNTFMSACVVFRATERKKDVPPNNALERYIDKAYPNERIKRIYPNMEYTQLYIKLMF